MNSIRTRIDNKQIEKEGVPLEEWDKLVVEHAPPNVLRVAKSTLAMAWAAHYSMPRTMHCEPLAAAKRSSTRAKKTKERSPFTRLPGIDAMAPCANRTFAAFTSASHRW
jgi:hypothetical protein